MLSFLTGIYLSVLGSFSLSLPFPKKKMSSNETIFTTPETIGLFVLLYIGAALSSTFPIILRLSDPKFVSEFMQHYGQIPHIGRKTSLGLYLVANIFFSLCIGLSIFLARNGKSFTKVIFIMIVGYMLLVLFATWTWPVVTNLFGRTSQVLLLAMTVLYLVYTVFVGIWAPWYALLVALVGWVPFIYIFSVWFVMPVIKRAKELNININHRGRTMGPQVVDDSNNDLLLRSTPSSRSLESAPASFLSRFQAQKANRRKSPSVRPKADTLFEEIYAMSTETRFGFFTD